MDLKGAIVGGFRDKGLIEGGPFTLHMTGSHKGSNPGHVVKGSKRRTALRRTGEGLLTEAYFSISIVHEASLNRFTATQLSSKPRSFRDDTTLPDVITNNICESILVLEQMLETYLKCGFLSPSSG
jgi:hypothetical protein